MRARGSGRRATQADVARLAGVSQSVVSLVLNNDAGAGNRRVGAEARRRVLEAIEVTGYAVNPVAQRLAGGRTRIIGVFTYEPLFPRDGGDFYRPFLVGMEAEAEQLGYDLLLFTSAPSAAGRKRLFGDGSRRLGIADGCVLLGRHDDKRDLAELLAQDFPFAFVGRRESEAGVVPYVGCDYVTATREVVDLLFSAGHRRVGFLGDLSSDESSADRVRGYRQAMGALSRRPVLLDGTGLTGRDALDLLLDNGLTAAVVGASGLASMIRAEALRRGLSVPGDISLAQLGDPEHAVVGGPEWTGFRIPREAMGARALQLVRAQLTSPRDASAEELQISLPCTVVEGETTGPPLQVDGRADRGQGG